MKKIILFLALSFALNEASFAQSITLEPSPNVNTGISFIKKGGIGLSHESSVVGVKIGTYVNTNGASAWIQTHTNHPLNFTTNNGETQMSLRTDGKLGIGTESPIAKLHVAGFSNVNTGLGNFFYPNVGITSAASFNANLSILADQGIVSQTYIGSAINVVASDNRIKNIIGLSNNEADLACLRKIEITDYRMKDVATWGTQPFKKVIAQQVETVYPEVIKKQTAVIPDIYALAEKVVYDGVNKCLTISLSNSYSIKIGEKIELVHPEKGKVRAEVVAVSGNSFTVKDWAYATDKIFVFGREVADFRSVDYEALSILGISAIQALAKEINELKKQNFQLKSDFESRLAAIEALLKPQQLVK